MARKSQDIIGREFGILTVKQRAVKDNKGNSQWLCKCKCGEYVIVKGYNLKNGNTSSCGCLRRINMSKIGIENKKYNTYDLSGEYGIGYTTKGEPFYFDLEDYDKIKDYCWYINKDGYVICPQGILLHSLIMNTSNNNWVDHIKHKKYDNRKSELRLVSYSQNAMNRSIQSNNTSGITGVYYDTGMKKWVSTIEVDKKKIHLGVFTKIEDAIKKRKMAEERYFGNYSYCNSMGGD